MAIAHIRFTDLVLERLQVCANDFGMKRTWKTAPKTQITAHDTPAAFGLIGGTFAPVGITSGQTQVGRTYIQRVLLAPFDGRAESLEGGSEVQLLALDWIDLIHQYYHDRPYLQTETAPPLRYCKGLVSSTDSGLVQRTAPGGIQFAAIDFNLNIVMAGKADRIAAAYNS